MRTMGSSELLFYGGLAAMAASVALAVLCTVLFRFSVKRLRRKLEQEYGKPEN